MMNEAKVWKKLTELWDEVATLSRDDVLFLKKRLFLYGQIIMYTIVLSTLRRIKRHDNIEIEMR